MSGVRLSEKHGVNPTISTCFWCGKEKNEIVLCGKLPGDKEAPMRAIINYEPCEECKAKMENGITMMEASSTPRNKNQAPMQKGIYPTGRWVVVSEEAISNAEIIKQRKCFIDEETWEKIGLPKNDITK